MIRVTDIDKYYGKNQVLRDISFTLERGKIHGFVGRNGSGKTVLFKILCGLTAPTSGEVFIDGKQLGRDMEIPLSIGAIINVPGFIPHMSGRKNLLMLASIRGKVGEKAVCKAMRSVGLDPKLRTPVSKYSTGMRQRLGIAQAIMENPQLLVLDEPMNGLDNRGVEEMRILLRKLKDSGKTILIASHNENDIRELCDTVHEMDGGVLKLVRDVAWNECSIQGV